MKHHILQVTGVVPYHDVCKQLPIMMGLNFHPAPGTIRLVL